MVLSIFQRFLDWLRALFFKEEMELTLVGLQYSGKTTFVNVLGKKSDFGFAALLKLKLTYKSERVRVSEILI